MNNQFVHIFRLISSLKILNHYEFVILRDIGLSWRQTAKKNWKKNQDQLPNQHMNGSRVIWVSRPKNRLEYGKNDQKTKKKNGQRCFERPKNDIGENQSHSQLLRHPRVNFQGHNQTIFEEIRHLQLRVCCEKTSDPKNSGKNGLWWCRKYLREPIYLWQKFVFTDETRVYAMSGGWRV